MTKSLAEALGIAPLGSEPAVEADLPLAETQTEGPIQLDGVDHGQAMDMIHDETLKHARELIDLAYNIDHARMRGVIEQGVNMYKLALDAKNSKRDAQLKYMKLLADQNKKVLTAPGEEIFDEDAIVEDRNALIERLRGMAGVDHHRDGDED